MLQKLNFRPGINRENTIYATEGGWYDMDKVRFRYGTPEKMGGWKTAVTGNYTGSARAIVTWAALTGEVLIGVGTNTRYYINYGSQYRNVTPLRSTVILVNPFSTTGGSTLVKVNAPQHGAQQGDTVIYSGAVAVSNLTAAILNYAEGYKVVSVIDSNVYTVNFGVTASSSLQGGGTAVTTTYELPSGLTVHATGGGWSTGTWNGPFTNNIQTVLSGTGRVALNASDTVIPVASTTGFNTTGTIVIDAEVITYTGVTGTTFTGCVRGTQGTTPSFHNRRQVALDTWAPILVKQVLGYANTMGWNGGTTQTTTSSQMRLWSHASYGQDLIACPRQGGLYYWAKDTANFARFVPIRDANDTFRKYVPHTVNFMLVADVSRFIMALGANPYDPNNPTTTFDPMLVRWSAQDAPTDWIPTAINQAGEIRLSSGSYLMSGVNMKQELLLWTDTALYSFQYIGPPYVWRSELSMSNLSLMGPNSVAVVNNNAFWMGTDKFYIYTGTVDTLPCTIQQYIFNDISYSQRFQTFAGTNEGFNEIWWFYVSNTEVVNATQAGREPTVDKYAIYNHSEQIWYYGSMNRTAWVDSALFNGPLACTGDSTSGVIVMHEQGSDDNTTGTPRPMSSYIQSSDFDIGDGHQYLFVWRLLPDVSFNGSTVASPKCIVTLYPRENSGSAYSGGDSGTVQSAQTYSPVLKQYTVQQFTQQIDTRVRGRALAFRIESNALGVQWKLGAPRIDARPDGRKS